MSISSGIAIEFVLMSSTRNPWIDNGVIIGNMMRWTIALLRRVEPEKRLNFSAYLFWISVVLGVLSVVFLAEGGYERVLMGISWGAITITCVDVILTADVRSEEED